MHLRPSLSGETTFQTFPCFFAIRKIGQWKTLSKSCEKFRNIILFANYNKFGPQTFDCYIYIFSISPLRI
jgi:hypothetical protein